MQSEKRAKRNSWREATAKIRQRRASTSRVTMAAVEQQQQQQQSQAEQQVIRLRRVPRTFCTSSLFSHFSPRLRLCMRERLLLPAIDASRLWFVAVGAGVRVWRCICSQFQRRSPSSCYLLLLPSPIEGGSRGSRGNSRGTHRLLVSLSINVRRLMTGSGRCTSEELLARVTG